VEGLKLLVVIALVASIGGSLIFTIVRSREQAKPVPRILHSVSQQGKRSIVGFAGDAGPIVGGMSGFEELTITHQSFSILVQYGGLREVPKIDTDDTTNMLLKEPSKSMLAKYVPELPAKLLALRESPYVIRTYPAAVGRRVRDLGDDDPLFVTYLRHNDVPISYATKRHSWKYLQLGYTFPEKAINAKSSKP
jgi:hypothetical protein